jgi:hypothetical protein
MRESNQKPKVMKMQEIKFETAEEYIKYLDKISGESWSNATDELADVMEDYAKMYHKRQLKLLGMVDVVGRSGQLVCGCEEPNVNHEDKPLPTCKDCFKPMV